MGLRFLKPFLLAALLILPSAGCETLAITGFTQTVSASADKQRSFGDTINDDTIYTEINHYFLQTDVHDLLMNIHITVRKGRVLLTGRTEKRETAVKAQEQAWKAGGVLEVIDEIEIVPSGTIFDRASDEWTKKAIEVRLTAAKGTNIFNYSIEVCNGVAYLVGLVMTEEENNKVLEVTRTTQGVKKVVSHLRLPTQYPEVPLNHG